MAIRISSEPRFNVLQKDKMTDHIWDSGIPGIPHQRINYNVPQHIFYCLKLPKIKLTRLWGKNGTICI